MFSFADIVKVPPLPTPDTGLAIPERYNFSLLFEFQTLSAMVEQFNREDPNTLVSLFGWDESFVMAAHLRLEVLFFGNSTVPSPYNKSVTGSLILNRTFSLGLHLIFVVRNT